jgi:hypothetical protein
MLLLEPSSRYPVVKVHTFPTVKIAKPINFVKPGENQVDIFWDALA